MRPLIFSLFIYLFSVTNLFAFDNYPIGARSAAVANASVTFSDVWSAFNNQAGLADLKTFSAGTYYENRFLVSELSLKGFAFALPVNKTGVFALSIAQFGGHLYNEKKAGLAFAKKLSNRFSLGVQLYYLATYIANDDEFIYGTKSAFSAEVGIIAEPIDNLKIGLHLFNPQRVKADNYSEQYVPTIVRFGASYTFSEKALVSSEVEKDINMKSIFKTGVEYHIVEQVFIRGGIATNPSLSSFGFGFKIRQWQFDIASSYHQVLGFSPQVSITFNK